MCICMECTLNISDSKGTFVSKYNARDVAYQQAKYQPQPTFKKLCKNENNETGSIIGTNRKKETETFR